MVAQENPRTWARPTEIGLGPQIKPIHVEAQGAVIRVDAVEYDSDDRSFVGRHVSTDGGATWKANPRCKLGGDLPLSFLSREKEIVCLCMGRDGWVIASIDPTSGKVKSHPFDPKPKIPDLTSTVVLLDYKGALWLFCIQMGDQVPQDLGWVFRSSDAGKTWEHMNEPWPSCSNGIMFEADGSLHVMFGGKGKDAQVSHYKYLDDSKSWKREPQVLSEELTGFPVAVHSKGAVMQLVVAVANGEVGHATLRTFLTADAGTTWKSGGVLYDTKISLDDPPEAVIEGCDSLFFLGTQIGKAKREARVLRSRDGGKSWLDLDVTAGTKRISIAPSGAVVARGQELGVVFTNFERESGEVSGNLQGSYAE